MKKRLTALLLAVCMLCTGMGACAQSEYPQVRSVEQLKGYLAECTLRLDDTIRFSYPKEMEELFEETDIVETILYNAGALSWTWTRYRAQRRIEIRDIEYYSGFRMARAWKLGREDLLTEAEQSALECAQRLVEQAADESRTPLELERWLHDEICRRTVYTLSPDGQSPHDTALGVLVSGQAECDGYADAFYLLCTLAGFNAAFQHGTTVESAGDSTHLWNLIEWNGMWYHVDVTWDDPDYEGYDEMILYRYFNVGGDMLRDHFWDGDLSLVRTASYTDWNLFFYTCAQAGEKGFGRYVSSVEEAARYAAERRAGGWTEVHVMVRGTHENGQAFNEAVKSVPVYGKWTTWTRSMGEYTLFDVLFAE